MSPQDIQKLFDSYEKECSEIKKNAFSLSWYMRGGVSYQDILNMSYEERRMMNELIEHNLETTKKSQLPFF